MNTATDAKEMGLLRSNLATPRNFHALWLILRLVVAPARFTLPDAGETLAGAATNGELRELLELGENLGLVSSLGSGAWQRTPEGKKFSSLPHWRYWNLPANAKCTLSPDLVKTLFIPKRRSEAKPIVIDLFSGVGGLSLAFEAAGFDVKVAVDNDRQACEAHRQNFPHCHVVEGDINEIGDDPETHLCKHFGIKRGSIAGVIGGPPCQGFSFIGERDVGDERNLLTSRYMDVVMALEPDFFLMENVAGLLSSGALPKFGVHIQRLGKSIGVPANAIVDRLPAVPTIIAKRDRQFRKRAVSQAITAYAERVAKQVRDTLRLEQTVDLLSETYAALPDWLTQKIDAAYVQEGQAKQFRGPIASAIHASMGEVCQIAIGLVIGSLLDKRLISDATTEAHLRKLIGTSSIPSLVRSTMKKIVDEYDAAPKAELYRGVLVGPILGHLIARASTKYDVAPPTKLNSAWYGAPQSRERLFIIGIHKRHRRAFSFPAQQFELPGKEASLFDTAIPTAPTVFDAIGDLPDVDLYESLIAGDEFPAKDLSPPHSEFASLMRLQSHDPLDLSLPRPSWNPFVVDCSNRTIHTEDVVERLKQTPEGIQEETSHKTRLNRDKVSHTLRAGTKEGKGSHTAVRPVHFEFHRVVTVREGARLMGYPDWMTFHHTKWHGFRLVGNGVPYQLGRALAASIQQQIKKFRR